MEPFEESLVLSNSLLTGLNLDQPLVPESRQKFLRFALGSQDSGLLPLEQISEVISVTVEEILPVPDMPQCVLGIYNWRGKMLWLVDLDHLVDDSPLLPLGQKPDCLIAMVIQVNEQAMGLVVQSVKDIELYAPEQIQSPVPGLFSPQLLPFVKGYLLSADSIVFNPEAIIRFPVWQLHRS